MSASERRNNERASLRQSACEPAACLLRTLLRDDFPRLARRITAARQMVCATHRRWWQGGGVQVGWRCGCCNAVLLRGCDSEIRSSRTTTRIAVFLPCCCSMSPPPHTNQSSHELETLYSPINCADQSPAQHGDHAHRIRPVSAALLRFSASVPFSATFSCRPLLLLYPALSGRISPLKRR